MEKILVGMNSKMTSLWAVIHALNLAKRINARISILFVTTSSGQHSKNKQEEDHPVRSQVEKLISDGRLEGLSIDYYLTCGSFKDELIKFIKEKKITLLVIEYPQREAKTDGEIFSEFIEEIKLRSGCRIEVVHPKK